ncbi:hypothetical protein [Sinorhizobium sp. NFACC03]|uniref:hypothetical protein n=1 Tax=Sinorhizobium sp. NFACC03 TaxID=1566295 RepID=UPI000B815474|nr:hypothetical protein [Sinorhizobium sp. NFACC03]
MLFDRICSSGSATTCCLLLRRGYEKFVAGEMSIVAFGKALSQEWASYPARFSPLARGRIACSIARSLDRSIADRATPATASTKRW